jgi:hypothetical protein
LEIWRWLMQTNHKPLTQLRGRNQLIIHVDANDVFLGVPSVSDLKIRIWRSKISDRRVTAKFNVKVLQLGRPVAREHPFGAGACRPADFGLADTCRRLFVDKLEPICRSVNFAICQTASAIEQWVGRDGDAKTAPHRAEPCKLWLGRKEAPFQGPKYRPMKTRKLSKILPGRIKNR